ncbi:MAG: ferredoxin [Spirochaetes bacterium]|nr:ferredoxin [Spirochaetota bacterium]
MARGVHVDAEECTGCELCMDTLPSVFTMNDRGVSVVHNENGASEGEIQSVIDNCPALCIHWK